MAVPSNTIQAVGRVGVREDLSDKIHELFPDEAPFSRAIGREKVAQVSHEWQTDALASANHDNKTIQGDDLSNESRPNTVRQGNYTQIMKKVVGASSTLEATKTAGRRSELAREIMKAGKELATDLEKRISGNYAAVAPTSSVAGEMAGALAFLRSNVSRGTSGVSPVYSGGNTTGTPTTAAVNGTLRNYTEALLKTVLRSVWNAGSNPSLVITSMDLKETAAAFTGLAQHRRETGDKKATIVAGADVYVGNTGKVQFVPSRFTSGRDALIVDPEYWVIGDLDPLKMIDLAKTGLATRKAMYRESTLICKNEAAAGVVADVQAV